MRKLLKKGGSYILRTPQKYLGPWDISRYFSDTPEGFHLKEWSYQDILYEARNTGFTKFLGSLQIKEKSIWLPLQLISFIETIMSILPSIYRSKLMQMFLPEISVGTY